MPELTQDGSRRMGLKNGRKGEEKAERGDCFGQGR